MRQSLVRARLRRTEYCICDATIILFDKNLARARFQRTDRQPVGTSSRRTRAVAPTIRTVTLTHQPSARWPRHPEPVQKTLESRFVLELAKGRVETQIEEIAGALLVSGVQALESPLAVAE